MPKDNESTMKWKIDIRELTTAMQTAKRNISQANAEFKNATAGMTRWQNSITGVEAKIKQLNSVSANQKEVLKQLNEEYKIIVKEFGEASPEAQKLATQILNQETAIKKTESQLSNYNDSLEELKQAEIDASSESSKLARTIESQEQELDSLKKAYKEAVLAKGADSKEAKTLANEITTLNGTLNENRAKMEEADKATDELTESLETADKEASEAGNGGFTVLKGALAGLVAEGISIAVEGLKDMAVALVDVGKAAIGNYADYEQLVGGVETLFKDASGTVQNYADERQISFYDALCEADQIMAVEHGSIIEVDAELELVFRIIIAHGAIPFLRLFLRHARKAQDLGKRARPVDRLRPLHEGGPALLALPRLRGEALQCAFQRRR